MKIRKFIINILFKLIEIIINDKKNGKYAILRYSEDYIYGDGYSEYFNIKFSELEDDCNTDIDKFEDTPNGTKFRVVKVMHNVKRIKIDKYVS